MPRFATTSQEENERLKDQIKSGKFGEATEITKEMSHEGERV